MWEDGWDEDGPLSVGRGAYAAAGVDFHRQEEALDLIRPVAESTRTPGLKSGLGLFGGLFSARFPEREPVLVSSMDSVGTKIMVARRMGRWDTIGQDLVNHCVNDVLVQGARPLFFLDYIASQRLDPQVVAAIVQGMAQACRASGCALLGGELAELPGIFAEGQGDVAGTLVGVAEEAELLPRLTDMVAGDVLIGLPSSGLHTNGYSLARKICFDEAGLCPEDCLPGTEQTVGEALLAVHRSYLAPVMPLIKDHKLLAMAHITGGGFTDNLPRVLPEGLCAVMDTSSWEIPPLFRFLTQSMDRDEARRCFNLGVGMVLILRKDEADGVLARLVAAGERPWVIGHLARGERGVSYG